MYPCNSLLLTSPGDTREEFQKRRSRRNPFSAHTATTNKHAHAHSQSPGLKHRGKLRKIDKRRSPKSLKLRTSCKQQRWNPKHNSRRPRPGRHQVHSPQVRELYLPHRGIVPNKRIRPEHAHVIRNNHPPGRSRKPIQAEHAPIPRNKRREIREIPNKLHTGRNRNFFPPAFRHMAKHAYHPIMQRKAIMRRGRAKRQTWRWLIGKDPKWELCYRLPWENEEPKG